MIRYLLIVLCCVGSIVQSFGQISESKKIKIKKGQLYLNFPVNQAAPSVRASIILDDKPLDQFTINLADANPQFWAYFDVSEYQGKTLVVEIENNEKVRASNPTLTQPAPGH